MKKIMISLLMVAATLNAMAITYTGKVQVVLRATSNNAACAAVFATSDALNDGLNPTYYAELNDEGKEVLAYVEYNNVRYEHFGSSAATMRNMPLVIKANASGEYKMEFYEMEGAIEIYDQVAGANIDKSQPYIFTIEDEQKNTVIADRFIINYDPDALKYDITLNDHYLATFSAPENVIIPDGLSAYTAKFQGEQGYLLVSKITGSIPGSIYIPANTGVILFNPEGGKGSNYQKNFSLFKYAGDVDPIEGINHLKPATVWASVRQEEGTNYVLHGSEMWLYNEANMKPNKAFLHVGVGNGAPQRIRMVFSEEQGIESIAAEGKAVKVVENGRVFIKRGEKIYNVQGQLVK